MQQQQLTGVLNQAVEQKHAPAQSSEQNQPNQQKTLDQAAEKEGASMQFLL